MAKTFTDSISGNADILRELIGGMPPQSRHRAKKAAVAIENIWTKLIKDHPKDPAVALGAVFALALLLERVIQQDEFGDPGPGSLIQLIN